MNLILKLKYNTIFIYLIIGCSFFLNGCFASQPTYHIKEDVDFSYIKRVAILPLQNFTSDKNASDAVRQVLITEFLSSGLADVVVPGDVLAALNNIGVSSISSPSIEEIRSIGKFLKVQAVITGSVDKLAEIRSSNVTSAEVTLTLMMVDTGAGDILWSVTATSGGAGFMSRHFGADTPTLSETISDVVKRSIQTLTGN
ncbi:MAG: hypothetical protein HY809_02710 [Nitrospirae bacterium]|nr:hypothetical protein [Nitrospirota bacterium]